jgi:hypothetical protein
METETATRPRGSEDALLSRLGKALSFRHVVPVALFSMIFVLALRQSVSLDPDLWWHLKTGEQIVNTKSIPHVDDYSFTKQGTEWVAHEWLSEVFIYQVFRLLGLTGLVVVFSLLIVGTLLIVYRRCDGQPYAASIAILLAAAASSPLFGIRPQMLTLLLASVYIALLETFRETGERRLLWWFPPMMLLWVNLHAGFALGLALIGFYLFGALLDRAWTRLLPLAIALVVCTAVVPLNPNGFRMFSYPYETLTSTSMAAFIEEWASPDFHRLMWLPVAVLLLATFGVMAASPRRPRASELFLVLITSLMALRSVRHIPIFSLIAAPLFAKHAWAFMVDRGWDNALSGEDRAASGMKLIINMLLVAAPLLLVVSRVSHFASHQRDYAAIRNPVAAVEFLKEHQLPGPIYNRYGWGGYLIYQLYPQYRVYIDGRADVYGDAFFTETMNLDDGFSGWRTPLDRHGVQTILIAPDVPLASLLSSDPQWAKVYETDRALIFTRRQNTSPTH